MTNDDGATVDGMRSGGVGEFMESLVRTAKSIWGSGFEVQNYTPAEHGSIVSFDGLRGYEELERYWLDAPFAFAVIGYHPEKEKHRYQVVVPELNELERQILDLAFNEIRQPLLYRETLSDNKEAMIKAELRNRLVEYGVDVDMPRYYRLFYYLNRDFNGFGKIDPLMRDPNVEDISCDGYKLPIYVYHEQYTDIETSLQFDNEDELDRYVSHLAQDAGQHLSTGAPTTQATLSDGSRAELTLGRQITPRGSAFTIRKYSEDPFTPVDLLEYGTFDLDQLAYLWMAIEHNKNLIFAGGTAAGKTTSMNALSMFITPGSKVISIEDTRELRLYHENWLSSITRERIGESEDITMYDLLRSALRHRPEYIIVGEIRGQEAMTLFQAMNTGHTTYSTMHADSIQTVINRLENDPINVPRAMIQSLDILCVQVLTRFEDRRVRRIRDIVEIEGIDQRTGDLNYSTAFRWDPTDDTVEQRTTNVITEIRQNLGWSEAKMLRELRRRRRVLRYLLEQGINDYRDFTAIVNEYYQAPERVIDRMDVAKPTAGSEPIEDNR